MEEKNVEKKLLELKNLITEKIGPKFVISLLTHNEKGEEAAYTLIPAELDEMESIYLIDRLKLSALKEDIHRVIGLT